MNKKISDKWTNIIYILISIIIFIFLITQIINKNLIYILLCVLTELLITAPYIIEKKYKLYFSNVLKISFIFLLFSCTILGEISHFYIKYQYFDTFVHLLYGFLCAGIGFLIADLLHKNNKNISSIYYLIISFTFSIAVGVSWEFCEYGMDKFFLIDTQKDTIIKEISSLKLNNGKKDPLIIKDIQYTIIYNKDLFGNTKETKIDGYLDIGLNDTMKDLLVMRLGAFIFTTLAYFHLKDNHKFSVINKFLAIKKDASKS